MVPNLHSSVLHEMRLIPEEPTTARVHLVPACVGEVVAKVSQGPEAGVAVSAGEVPYHGVSEPLASSEGI